MGKFKSKAFEIEAVQFNKDGDHHAVRWGNTHWSVMGHQGFAKVNEGDWIIAEPDGDGFYPCDPVTFAAKYEAIDEHMIDLNAEFLVARVSQDGKQIGIDHPTDAPWNDVLLAHVALKDRMIERINEMGKCPLKPKESKVVDQVSSSSDDRTVNNDVRHQYRVLTDAEKQAMVAIKDVGLDFLQKIEVCCPPGREASLAKTKVEEAVMWAVKGITG